MKCFMTLCLLAGGLVATLGLATARAGDPLGKATTLSAENLKEMLDNLGLAPEEIKSTAGHPMCKINLERDGWRYYIYVSLSPNKTKIWVSTPVADLSETEKAPAASLEKMLTLNDELGPTHFSLKGRRMYLNTPIENIGVTPKQLRTEIDNLVANTRKTSDQWKELHVEKATAAK